MNSKARSPCLLAFISQVVNYCAAGIIPGQWSPVGQRKIFQVLALCSVPTFLDHTTGTRSKQGGATTSGSVSATATSPSPLCHQVFTDRSQPTGGLDSGHVSRPIVKNAGVPRRVSSQWNCARVAHSVVCGRLWSVPHGISGRKFFMMTDATSKCLKGTLPQIFLVSVSVLKDGQAAIFAQDVSKNKQIKTSSCTFEAL